MHCLTQWICSSRIQGFVCSRYYFGLRCAPALIAELNFTANSYYFLGSWQCCSDLAHWALHPWCPSHLPMLPLNSWVALELVPYSVMQSFQFSFCRASFQTSAELIHLSSKERPECDPVLSLRERLSSYHIHILQRKRKHLSPSQDAEEGSSCDFSIYQFL